MAQTALAVGVQQTFFEISQPRFDVLSYPERLDEILELRRLANVAANQISSHSSAADLFDPRDPHASNIVAEIGGQIVGTVRLAPPLEGLILNRYNPCLGPISGLPESSDYLETAWAAVHPDFHGRGILWHLAAHMMVTAKKRGKPFVVGGASVNMWRFWQRCGFRKLGISYVSRNAPDTHNALIALDVEAAIAGREIAPQLARALAPLVDGLA